MELLAFMACVGVFFTWVFSGNKVDANNGFGNGFGSDEKGDHKGFANGRRVLRIVNFVGNQLVCDLDTGGGKESHDILSHGVPIRINGFTVPDGTGEAENWSRVMVGNLVMTAISQAKIVEVMGMYRDQTGYVADFFVDGKSLLSTLQMASYQGNTHKPKHKKPAKEIQYVPVQSSQMGFGGQEVFRGMDGRYYPKTSPEMSYTLNENGNRGGYYHE